MAWTLFMINYCFYLLFTNNCNTVIVLLDWLLYDNVDCCAIAVNIRSEQHQFQLRQIHELLTTKDNFRISTTSLICLCSACKWNNFVIFILFCTLYKVSWPRSEVKVRSLTLVGQGQYSYKLSFNTTFSSIQLHTLWYFEYFYSWFIELSFQLFYFK